MSIDWFRVAFFAWWLFVTSAVFAALWCCAAYAATRPVDTRTPGVTHRTISVELVRRCEPRTWHSGALDRVSSSTPRVCPKSDR